jgi:AcrR family transcriptional regulator
MEPKDKIIHQSLILFLKKGVKQVNMDEVASNLGISKKTLYIHFNNKQDLVHQCFKWHTKMFEEMVNNSNSQVQNAIDGLFAIDEGVSLMMKKTNPYLLGELKRYYPKTWGLLEELKQKVLFNIMKNNLINGIQQGLYRSELDVDIVTKLIISRTDALVNDEVFPLTVYNFKDLLKEIRIYHIRGIATPKGIKHLENKINE